MDDERVTATGDDYSYDLAHEVPPAGGRPTRSRRHRQAEQRSSGRPDEVGDYSYDLAHEVPAPERQER